jgi:hypothetical protein
MGSPGLVAILDHCLAELEEYKQQVISELTAAQSSLSTLEDTLEDPEIRLILEAIDYLKDIRKKLLEKPAR